MLKSLTGFISVTVWLIFIHNFFFAGVAIALLVHEVEELGLLSDTTWNQYFSKMGCCVTLSKYFLFYQMIHFGRGSLTSINYYWPVARSSKELVFF